MNASQSEDRAPEFELSTPDAGTIHYLEHGYPSPLVRWHHHNAYELHYIVASSGRVFVGDYVGEFEPGCLILTGPRLPHNWISDMECADRVDLRDMLVQFDHSAIEGAASLMPEFCEVLPLMESARLGIEFAGMHRQARGYMSKIRDTSGLSRLSYFCQFLHDLAQHPEQRTLSSGHIETFANDAAVEKINVVVNFMARHFHEKISLSEAADLLNMNASYFSRFFSKTTGTTFGGFLTQIRIGKACELLSTTDQQITSICYDVGYTSIANFNRRFLEHKKMTPREYRRQTQERLSRDYNELASDKNAEMAFP